MIIKRRYGSLSKSQDKVDMDVIHLETDSDLVLVEGANKNLTEVLSDIQAEKDITLTGGVIGSAKMKPGSNVSIETTVDGEGHTHNVAQILTNIANRVMISNSEQVLDTSTITVTELAALHEIDSNIQAQLNGKAPISHGAHVSFSEADPSAPGTAAAGTSNSCAHADHVHPLQTSVSGNAGSATQLKTSRNLKVNLASSAAAGFDGTNDASLGVEGILGTANGGTGNATGNAPTASKLAAGCGLIVDLAKLESSSFDGSAGVDLGVKGTLGVAHGGTGAATADDARSSIGAAAAGHDHDSAYLKQALLGAASGIAPLGSDGKIPSSYLPSFVDDVLEGTVAGNLLSFTETGKSSPVTPESGKIYVDTATGKTYRWSGSAYVEISKSLALGSTAETAYRGDLGAAAYAHSQAAHAPSDANKTEKSDTNGNIKIAGTETVVYTHPSITCTASTDTATLTSGGTFVAISDMTVNGNGHVTAKTAKTFTLPSIVNIQVGSTQPTNQEAGDLWFQNI